MHDEIARRIEAGAGSRVVRSEGTRVRLADGRRLFVKADAGAPRGMFSSEASGLARLRAANALRVPEVFAYGETEGAAPAFIAMELLDGAPPNAEHDEDLGRGLAALHRTTAPAHGLDEAGFIATLAQDNTPSPSWPAFYRDRRLAPLATRAAGRGLLGRATLDRFERLFASIDRAAATNDPPALLHGDLWSGNAITDENGAPCLIDPSVYFGAREIDLAMMKLFGGFGARVFAAYREAWPLEAGHEARVALYQLYPLLVHVHLFGGSYVGSLEAALDRSLALV